LSETCPFRRDGFFQLKHALVTSMRSQNDERPRVGSYET